MEILKLLDRSNRIKSYEIIVRPQTRQPGVYNVHGHKPVAAKKPSKERILP
jgi:hypothetical protein